MKLLISTYQGKNLLSKETVLGKLKNNILFYSNDTDKFSVDLNHQEFTKESVDNIVKVSRHQCELTIKELNQSTEIDMAYFEFTVYGNTIEIIYLLESQTEPLKITIVVGDPSNG